MKKTLLVLCLVQFLTISIFSQTVKLKVGDDADAYWPNLEAAFNDINSGFMTGPTLDFVLEIIADCTPQSGTAILYPSGYAGGSSYRSVTIYPTVSGRTISSNVVGPLIELNGVDGVVINGSLNGTGSTPDLTIINTSIDPFATTISLTESAVNNSISYCIIKGSGTGSGDASSSIMYFNASSSGTGNNNNHISHNIFTSDSPGRPENAIYSVGASGVENSGNFIEENSFYDILSKSQSSSSIINLSDYNTGWTISNNNFYETSSFIPAVNSSLTAININSSTGNDFIISDNFIGGSAAACGGTAWTKTNAGNNTFNGINITVGTTSPTNIQGNTISNFSWANSGSADWTAINIAGGYVNIGTTTGNTIGSLTGTGAVVVTGGATGLDVTGLYFSGTGTVNCSGNSLGSFTVSTSAGTFAANFYGIKKTATTGTTTITDNIIGSETTSNSIRSTSVASINIQTIYGIESLGTGNVTINGNIIANLSNATTNASGVLGGIYYNGGTGTNAIEKNYIHDLSAACQVAGISLTKGVVTCANNIISLGGNLQTSLAGIYTSGGAADNYLVYFNTAYLAGSPTAGSQNSACLFSNTSAESRDFRNNLLVNSRSNSGASGKHYAVFFNSSATPPVCNYNNYFVSGTGGVIGYYGGDKTTQQVVPLPQDANSLAENPVFPVPAGSYSDYRPSNATLVAGLAGLISDDYSGLARATTPTIGALEIGSCTNPTSGGNITLSVSSGCSPFNPANISSPAPSDLPSGYIGILEYQWQVSTTGAGSGFTEITGANSASYDPGSLTVNTWYKRLARVTCSTGWTGAAESNVVAVTVNTPPVAGAITGAAAVCNGYTTTLIANATGTPVLTYTWASSNHLAATVNNSGFVTSVGPGSTDITYTVKDGNTPGCQATSPVFPFTVNAPPSANPITGDHSVCSNGSLTLTANASGTAPLSYTWTSNHPEYAIVNSSGVITPGDPGSTDIRYTVTDGSSTTCSAQSAPFTVTVKAAPVAAAITGSNSACPGGSVTLTSHATGTPVLTYTWNSSNPGVAGVNNSGVVTAVSSGTTNITYTVTDGNPEHCAATSPDFVFTVNALPSVGLAIGGSGSVCSGTGTNITVALSETGVSYQLRNASGDINVGSPVTGTGGTINLPTGNLTVATTFNILATNITTTCSAQLTETETVTVDQPSAGGSVSGGTGTLVYGGSTGTMTLSGHTGTVVKWQKQLGSGSWEDITNTALTYSETPTSTGTWQYRVKVQNGACPDALSTSSSTAVTPKALTITADNKSKSYGNLMVFTGSEFTSAGLIFSDAVTSVTLASSGTPANAVVASSPYTIIPSAATGTGLENYTITYVNGSLTVNPAQLTINAADLSKTYGASFTFTGSEFSSTGLQSWDVVSSVSLASSGSVATALVSGSPYSIIPSSAVGTGLSNYTITYVNGSLAVNPASLTITADNATKVYGTNLVLPGTSFISSGLLLNDGITGVTLTSSGSAANAGVSGSPYSIMPSAAHGTGLGNYTISYSNGLLTVTKAPLIAKADDKTRKYNESNPAFTITYSGFVNNETPSVVDQAPSAQSTATLSSPIGTYPITVTGGSDDNYAFSYQNGTLTINKQQQSITITNAPEKLQIGSTYTLAASASSGLIVAFESLNPDIASVSGASVTGISKGNARIRAFSSGEQNYDPAEAFTEIEVVSSHRDIMNLFTPNGDGFNDYWELPLMSEWGRCDVKVYNRWGKIVFENPDYDNRWTGTSAGAQLPEGAYYYIIKTENAGTVKGTVNIVR